MNNKPMSDLLEQLAEQCCKLEHDEPWRPYAHFDRSRAETLITNYEGERNERVTDLEQTLSDIINTTSIESFPEDAADALQFIEKIATSALSPKSVYICAKDLILKETRDRVVMKSFDERQKLEEIITRLLSTRAAIAAAARKETL